MLKQAAFASKLTFLFVLELCCVLLYLLNLQFVIGNCVILFDIIVQIFRYKFHL